MNLTMTGLAGRYALGMRWALALAALALTACSSGPPGPDAHSDAYRWLVPSGATPTCGLGGSLSCPDGTVSGCTRDDDSGTGTEGGAWCVDGRPACRAGYPACLVELR